MSPPPRSRTPGGTPLHSAVTTVFPWKSFIGIFDLKQGSVVISLFALFNKIVGVFGIIAIVTNGAFSQISLYVYSLATIFCILWGMRGISDEDARTVMAYSHFFVADHLISSIWTFYFARQVFTSPHNGDPPQTGQYQKELMQLIEKLEQEYGETRKHSDTLTGAARAEAAQQVWDFEKNFATLAIVFGWFLKIFFALTLYSYALHLRHGTYASLPLAKSSSMNVAALHQHQRHNSMTAVMESDESDDDAEEAEPSLDPYGQPNRPRTSLADAGPSSATDAQADWWPSNAPQRAPVRISSDTVQAPRAQHGTLLFGQDDLDSPPRNASPLPQAAS